MEGEPDKDPGDQTGDVSDGREDGLASDHDEEPPGDQEEDPSGGQEEDPGGVSDLDDEAVPEPEPLQLDLGESALEQSVETASPIDGASPVDTEGARPTEVEQATALVETSEKQPDADDGPDTQEIVIPEMPLTQRVVAPAEPPSPIFLWWGWSMVALFSLVVGVGVVTGILGRAVLLDIVSFWPVFGVLALAAIAVRSRFSHRIRAILPLFIATWLGVAVALHLAGWSVLPSAVGDMAGVPTGAIEQASMSLEIDGRLVLHTGSDQVLYSVVLPREGGRVSAPQALETATGDSMSIELAQRNQSFWFSSSGWDVAVSNEVLWTFHIVAQQVDMDLGSVATSGGSLVGNGTLRLGSGAAGDWELVGDLVVSIPETVGILVIGEANLPVGWAVTEVGRQWGETVTLTLAVADGATVEIVTY